MWGESGRVGCIRSRVWALAERKWRSWWGGWIYVGVLGGEWTRESEGGKV